MPYASDRDRKPHDLELSHAAVPLAPLNLFLTSGYQRGVFDLTWTDPSELALNSRFNLLGINIYRSFDSEYGPYERLTEVPLGSTFYRDQTDNVLVPEEVVEWGQWVLKGENTGSELEPRYVFRTLRAPIVTPGSQALPESDPNEVIVTIDGVRARVRKVIGSTGEIELDTRQYPEVGTQTLVESPVPMDGSVVKVTYRYNRSLLKTDLGTRVYYLVTTVGNLGPGMPLLETSLERAASTTSREIEKLDYVWTEAVRRNRWILQQGGERVKVFLRKTVGETCSCMENTRKHAINDCPYCYGVGIVGGYEGPFDIVIAPDDAERRLNHTEKGMQQEHTYEVWTGPSPLLSQRDFVVKLNGERYSIGGVRMPTNRGMQLQQHFNIGIIDEQDFRYRVPMGRPASVYSVDPSIPPNLAGAVITSKENIPDERELKGRTKTWENITYALPFFLFLQPLVDAMRSVFGTL